MVITAVTPTAPVENTPFSVIVQVQDSNGDPVAASAATAISLGIVAGTGDGALTGATATIGTGQSAVTLPGVAYDRAAAALKLSATVTSGDGFTAGQSDAIQVKGVAKYLVTAAPTSPAAGSQVTVTAPAA
ncbi:MAG: hypothetical protein NTZ05_01200, partial [Chloroflexi bacterium]|nr:hypothetical protein [Chloroflexota bacterium]